MLKSSFALILVIVGQILSFTKVQKFNLVSSQQNSYKLLAKIPSSKGIKRSFSNDASKQKAAFIYNGKKPKLIKSIIDHINYIIISHRFYLLKNPAIFDFNSFRLLLLGCCMNHMA